MIQTSQGLMTAEEIGDHLLYSSWLWNKTYWGASEKTLRGFFGDVNHEAFENRYRRENRK